MGTEANVCCYQQEGRQSRMVENLHPAYSHTKILNVFNNSIFWNNFLFENVLIRSKAMIFAFVYWITLTAYFIRYASSQFPNNTNTQSANRMAATQFI